MINDSTQYIARISYGKDSLKMLEVIKSRGLPLDRITTTDVWATDTISANLPPMMAFKDRMDQRIWDMYRIQVEHLCALNKDGSKKTYEQMFYHIPVRRSQIGNVERERERESRFPPGAVTGFPVLGHPWCQSELKKRAYRVQGSITGFPPNTGYNWCQKLKLSNLGQDQGMATVQQTAHMVPTPQEPCQDPMGSQHRYLPGAENSRSTRSRHPLCGAPHEAQRQKYRGISGHCCR